jgi:hypothetical protein
MNGRCPPALPVGTNSSTAWRLSSFGSTRIGRRAGSNIIQFKEHAFTDSLDKVRRSGPPRDR